MRRLPRSLKLKRQILWKRISTVFLKMRMRITIRTSKRKRTTQMRLLRMRYPQMRCPRTMNPFMKIQTMKPVLKMNTTPMTTVMRSIQIRNPFLRMNLMRNRFLNMMMQIWAVRILNHLLSVPLRISKSPIPPMQVQAWIPRSLPPFQRQKMERKVPACGMT